MKLGRFLTNTADPNGKYGRMHFVFSNHAHDCGMAAMDQEWQHHLDYINEHIVGPPKGTEKWSVAELEEQGMIGIYAHPE
jgi:hypothetical protein